eukprot:3588821-Rhodomonas_salina.4
MLRSSSSAVHISSPWACPGQCWPAAGCGFDEIAGTGSISARSGCVSTAHFRVTLAPGVEADACARDFGLSKCNCRYSVIKI